MDTQDQAAVAENEEPVSLEPAKLQEAIRLYENPTSAGDAETAVKVFNQFAYSNNPEGQYYLGLARWEGKGADQSGLEAYVWWTIAARQKHQEAQKRIEDREILFNQDDLDEIRNRADDWDEKVRSMPELQ